MKLLPFFLLSLVFLFSCESDKDEIVTVDQKYSIALPSFLTKTDDLNKEASLQYKNGAKEFYVIVIDESKQEFGDAIKANDLGGEYGNDIKTYSNVVFGGIDESVPGAKKSAEMDTVVNGMPAKFMTVNGKVENENAFYYFAVVEGKKNYYQIVIWTEAAKEAEFKDKMKHIITSLKEL